jgi:transketolase
VDRSAAAALPGRASGGGRNRVGSANTFDASAAKELARHVRHEVLEQAKRANVGHIGSALSVADILAVVFSRFVDPTADRADRARFILSKGHAALALYSVLHLHSLLDDAELGGYCSDGSMLGVHPEHAVAGIDVSTGSLGHGMSIAVGCALAARLQNSPTPTVYVLISDAELDEGSVWEALMFAGHHQLENLVVILDANGQQALGRTRDVIDLGSPREVARKVRSFGWQARVVDGHDCEQLAEAIGAASGGAPRMVVARTIAGRGVSYMEGEVAWHYLPMNDEQFARAIREVDG